MSVLGLISSINKAFTSSSSNLRVGDSSDDERDNAGGNRTISVAAVPDALENEEYIKNGKRGVMVFHTYSVKADRQKSIHVNLYTQQIIQYYDAMKRTFMCDEICHINRAQSNNCLIELQLKKKSMGMHSRIKKLLFVNETMAHRFHQCVDFVNDSGKHVRDAFHAIDYRGNGLITASDLMKAFAKVDLIASTEDIDHMLSLSTAQYGLFDFHDFFHLFLESFVSNLRSCLQEWLTIANNIHLIQEEVISPDADNNYQGSNNSPSTTCLSRVETSFQAIPGEQVAITPSENVHWCVYPGKTCKFPHRVPGVLYVTNYRVILYSLRKSIHEHHTHSRYDVPPFFNIMNIPLTTIQRIHIASPGNSIYLTCKDYRTICITLSAFERDKNFVDMVYHTLIALSFYTTGRYNPKAALFAFKNLTYLTSSEEGWNICDIIKEYVRQGLYDMKEWQVLKNKDYKFIDTYPRFLVIPKEMSKDEIITAAKFRSRNRMPCITYLHKPTGAVLTRSAQPMVGLSLKSCPEDEKLLDLYRCKGRNYSSSIEEEEFMKFYIFDCRGKVAATFNMAAGRGTEDASQYRNTELLFCNLDNIHVMRNAAMSFAEALSGDSSSSSSIQQVDSGVSDMAQLFDSSNGGFYSKIEESGWLRHIRLILISSVMVAEKLHFEGASVLVHCSDGWDRTSQIVSIAQVLIDPFYRTIEGIATLIEKDWCAFGHKFDDRCGHGFDHSHHSEERSPIFLQFLDVLHQILRQFPIVFEYTDDVLVFLVNHSSSCLFGNFLGNSERQREQDFEVKVTTKSIWAYISDHRTRFINPHCQAYNKPIWPSTGMPNIVIWTHFWLRWDVSAHPNNLTGSLWHDDWGRGNETDPTQASNISSYHYVAVKRSHDDEGKVIHDHDRPRSIGTSDTTMEGEGAGVVGGRSRDTRISQRLSVVWSASMEIDEDDYVIEDKESICSGEASGQTMLDRPTLHAMEGQSLSTTGLPLPVDNAASVVTVDSGSTASNSSNNIMMSNISNSSHHGSSNDDDHDDHDDDDGKNRYNQNVRHTSTSSIDNSYDRIEAQDLLLLHDEQKLLESIM